MAASARRAWLLLSLVLVAAPLPAHAQEPCASDVARHCSGRPASELLSCLQAHRADLAPACQDFVEYAMVSAEALLQDCQPDAFQLCRNVGRGEPTLSCLNRNQGKLTRRCQEFFDIIARAEPAAAKGCAAEVARDCPKAAAGKGDLYICLLYQGKNLSPACRKAMVR